MENTPPVPTTPSSSSSKLPSALYSASERLQDEVREVSLLAKQDASSIKQWALDVANVVVHLFIAGVKDSFLWANPQSYQGSAPITKALATRESQIRLVRFVAILVALLFVKDYLAQWLYWPLVIYLNEAINYYIISTEYSQTLGATAFEAKEKIISIKDNVAQTTSQLVRQTSNLIKRTTSSSSSSSSSSSDANASDSDASISRRRRRKASSLILARVLVAKVLSYCLIYAYLHEVVELINFLDIPITGMAIMCTSDPWGSPILILMTSWCSAVVLVLYR
jgi:hypothetical protein